MKFCVADSVELMTDGRRTTDDGYLVASVRCARTGIQEYNKSEIPGLGIDRDVIRVLRPESEVFSADSMRSYAYKPATDDHPPVAVDANNWKAHTIGNIGGEVARDGEYVRVPLVLMDASAVKKVDAGKVELSMGYQMDIVAESGTTESGEAYDAVMRNLHMNHIALVDRGRAGPKARIGDSWGGGRSGGTGFLRSKTRKSNNSNTNDNKGATTVDLKTIVVDGFSVETTDAAAQVIDRQQARIKELTDTIDAEALGFDEELTAVKATHDKALATKDAELAAKDAEIKELKDAQLSAADLDKRVADRAALIDKAGKLAKDFDCTGKTDLEIKTGVVAAVNGADMVADKSPEYIAAAFDLCKVSSVRDALITRGSGGGLPASDADNIDMEAIYAAQDAALMNPQSAAGGAK